MVPTKLHGRAFYENIGSPRYVVAPMVDQSEFAWRLLTRSFLPAELRTSILAYSPMLHAKIFANQPKYRNNYFKPLRASSAIAQPADGAHQKVLVEDGDAHLDGNPNIDRPFFVQFCANEPDQLLEAAKLVQPYCDAVDLNLGCPQGIAKRGHYGAFLQEDWDTIHKLINTLHNELDVPVTAKMRILETKERTLEYAKTILSAGASIITVHGRQRDQKGHNTGLADWSVIRYLREQLPPETVIFANGNILQHADLQRCLEETKADGVMSAEANLYNPTIFATEPSASEEEAAGGVGRLYWRGRDGKRGYRMDAVLRRYMNIIYCHVLEREPPQRKPLFMPFDTPAATHIEERASHTEQTGDPDEDGPPPVKKQRRAEAKQKAKESGKQERSSDINLVAMKAHCFHLLRQLISKHTNVRDALARTQAGDMAAFEHVLELTEAAVKEGLQEYESNPKMFDQEVEGTSTASAHPTLSSDDAVKRCKRPYWVCQPHVRPLPTEAIEKGSMQLSKKEKARLQQQDEDIREAGLPAEGSTEKVAPSQAESDRAEDALPEEQKVEVAREGLVCG